MTSFAASRISLLLIGSRFVAQRGDVVGIKRERAIVIIDRTIHITGLLAEAAQTGEGLRELIVLRGLPHRGLEGRRGLIELPPPA